MSTMPTLQECGAETGLVHFILTSRYDFRRAGNACSATRSVRPEKSGPGSSSPAVVAEAMAADVVR